MFSSGKIVTDNCIYMYITLQNVTSLYNMASGAKYYILNSGDVDWRCAVLGMRSLRTIYWTRHRASDKHVLANILRSRYVARTPPLEARSPGRRSNVENAPRRRPVTGQAATPASHIRRAILRTSPVTCRYTGQQRAHTAASVRTMSSYHGMDASL